MIKIYADTSVFGGVFDQKFCEASRQFFDEVASDNFLLVTSAVVEAEIEPAPEEVRNFFASVAEKYQVSAIDQNALELQEQYIAAGIVTEKSIQDALHVAIATIAECDLIVSWNFKHIVHYDKIPKYNAINILNGYKNIGIYSPLEVIQHGTS